MGRLVLAGLDFGNIAKILNLPDPSSAQDAATKNYVDTGLATKPTATLDTDGTLTANSDSKVASQKAVKTYVDQIIAAQDAMVFKGVIDCSASPNYPAADRGWTYRVSVAGKIGGASGVNVEVGDLLLCLTDGTSSGNQATVGSAWSIAQANLDGAVIGPSSVTDGNPVVFDGTTGKLIKQMTFAAFKTALSLSSSDVGLGNVTNNAQVKKAASSTNGAIPTWNGTTGDALNTGGLTAPSGAIVGTTDSQTLTNKSLTSPALTGSPTAPTQSPGDNSTKVATTAYVDAAAGATLGADTTTSGATTKSWTGLPSTIKQLTFSWRGGSTSTGSSTAGIQLGDATTGGFVATGYTGETMYSPQANGTLTTIQAAWSASAIMKPGSTGTGSYTATITLVNPTSFIYQIAIVGAMSGGGVLVGVGYVTLAGLMDRVQIISSSGNLGGGNANISYLS